jgi:hypothetical protein
MCACSPIFLSWRCYIWGCQASRWACFRKKYPSTTVEKHGKRVIFVVNDSITTKCAHGRLWSVTDVSTTIFWNPWQKFVI